MIVKKALFLPTDWVKEVNLKRWLLKERFNLLIGKERISMDFVPEWQRRMVEKYWMPEEEKVEKKYLFLMKHVQKDKFL